MVALDALPPISPVVCVTASVVDFTLSVFSFTVLLTSIGSLLVIVLVMESDASLKLSYACFTFTINSFLAAPYGIAHFTVEIPVLENMQCHAHCYQILCAMACSGFCSRLI